jgi:hypothetical protein
MIKSWSIIFGIGLGILWLAGLGAPSATPWMTWFNALGALCSFLIAAGVSDSSARGRRVSSTLMLSIGLFALWIVGLAVGVVAWQTWWTFAFACGFLVLSIGSGSVRTISATQLERDERAVRDRFRKSA